MALANVDGVEAITCIHGDDLLVFSNLMLPKFEPPKFESATFARCLNYGVLCLHTKLFLYYLETMLTIKVKAFF